MLFDRLGCQVSVLSKSFQNLTRLFGLIPLTTESKVSRETLIKDDPPALEVHMKQSCERAHHDSLERMRKSVL